MSEYGNVQPESVPVSESEVLMILTSETGESLVCLLVYRLSVKCLGPRLLFAYKKRKIV